MTDWMEKISGAGAQKTAVVPVGEICFDASLIELCAMNSCGNYGKNWTCPPLVGETEALIARAKQYQYAAVFSCVYTLEDSFDIEGMERGSASFRTLVQAVGALCRESGEDVLLLGAGGCRLCPECSAGTGEACRHPERAYASLESHGIFVSRLAEAANMKYINGQNTVTYFGAVLYHA